MAVQSPHGNFATYHRGTRDFAAYLDQVKRRADVRFQWYPYSTLANFEHVEPLVTDEYDFLFEPGKSYADIGGADGDLSFYLAEHGNNCHLYDFGPTNMNNLQGARYLQRTLDSPVEIFELDLDSQFHISHCYDLIFCLGILYHIKNPYFLLEKLAGFGAFMLLSTRVARRFRAGGTNVANVPAAYLLGPDESNHDATNFWIFTDAGLKRLVSRAGWEVVRYRTVGDTIASNPQDNEHDERAFALLRSRGRS